MPTRTDITWIVNTDFNLSAIPQFIKGISERELALIRPWRPAMPPYSQPLPYAAEAQPQWLVRGLAAPSQTSNKLRLLNISRLTNSELTLLIIFLSYTFFIHKINWHPNKTYFTRLRLDFSPNQYWPYHRRLYF